MSGRIQSICTTEFTEKIMRNLSPGFFPLLFALLLALSPDPAAAESADTGETETTPPSDLAEAEPAPEAAFHSETDAYTGTDGDAGTAVSTTAPDSGDSRQQPVEPMPEMPIDETFHESGPGPGVESAAEIDGSAEIGPPADSHSARDQSIEESAQQSDAVPDDDNGTIGGATAAPADRLEFFLEKLVPEHAPGSASGDPREEQAPEASQARASDSTPGFDIAEFHILDRTLAPGERADLRWTAGQSFEGQSLETPVTVIHGSSPGPVLCLTAAVHGDELNGVEIVRRVTSRLSPSELSGTVIAVPIVNILGFTRGSRYLPDRRDLNRFFPGNPRGSAASRIAWSFFHQVISRCDYLVDFHTGSLKRSNVPQLRADLSDVRTYEFTRHFGPIVVLHHSGGRGTLRRAAADAGVASVTFELGEPNWLQMEHVRSGVTALDTLMAKLKLIKRFRLWSEPPPVYYASRWLRADRGGILLSDVRLGQRVRQGDLLGTVTNPLSSAVTEIRAPLNGRILGMALDQFVLPGFATYHIGIATDDSDKLLGAADANAPDPDGDPDEFTSDLSSEYLPFMRSLGEPEPE
jgi:predicted deacylase